ncbi:MAG: hypothetical protein Tsb006_3290 [Rickettsiaceae bacterium]
MHKSKIIKLLALSFLVVGCKGMYGEGMDKKGAMKQKVDAGNEANVSRHVTNHVGHVVQDAATTASTVSNAANKLVTP